MKQGFPRRIGFAAGLLLALWLALRFLLPIVMPFLLALALTLLAEPLVSFFQKTTRLPRWAGAALGITIALSLSTLLLMTLGAFLLRELASLAGVLPDLESTALNGLDALRDWLSGMAESAPIGIRPILTHSVDGIFSDSTEILDRFTGKMLGLASSVLSHLPDSALGFGTWILACYMISAKLPALKAAAARLFPRGKLGRILVAGNRIRSCVGGWLLAQLKLMGVTFGVLLAGLFLLQVPYAPLWALGISLVDALPVLGTGTVLIPWSLVEFLQDNTPRAIGILGIYIVIALLRSVLEPRLVGKQLGLDPLLTLFCMYAGYRVFGFGGMLLSPLIAVTVLQLCRISPGESPA